MDPESRGRATKVAMQSKCNLFSYVSARLYCPSLICLLVLPFVVCHPPFAFCSLLSALCSRPSVFSLVHSQFYPLPFALCCRCKLSSPNWMTSSCYDIPFKIYQHFRLSVLLVNRCLTNDRSEMTCNDLYCCSTFHALPGALILMHNIDNQFSL